jgi:uncharacterized protein
VKSRAPAGDEEGLAVPPELPPVIDAHVHLFPDRLLQAIFAWFRANAWPIRYELAASAVAEYLLSRGVDRIVALHYAHKPGIARDLNRFVAEIAAADPRIAGVATVHPDDAEPEFILREAFAAGLRGVKLHCHVQAMPPDEPRLDPIYALCQEAGRPLVIHAGREPRCPGYRIDPHQICSADRIERVLRSFPRLQLVVPHLGADEYPEYAELLARYDNLWLDTTMVLAEYFAGDPSFIVRQRPERILYGTDFPNLPYAWDRELKKIAKLGLPPESLALILGENARSLFFSGE